MKKKLKIIKRMSFHAGHQLPSHDGKCKNFHGHRYTIEVGVQGPVTDEGSSDGMIIDFYDFDELLKRYVYEPMDHAFLSAGDEPLLAAFKEQGSKIYNIGAPTTVENISMYLFDKLTQVFDIQTKGKVEVCLVRVYETPDTFAEVVKDQGCARSCGGSCACG